MENTATLAHQKKKLSKLKDALNSLVARFHESDTRDRRRNDDLTDEYRRIT
jgi:dynein regulatory complex protein 1